MPGPVFVDTNVFVYRLDSADPEKQLQAERWLDFLWREGSARTSLQVLQELYATLTRKVQKSLSPTEARDVVQSLFAWKPVPVDERTLEGAWSLQDRYSLSWWDALILSAAQLIGCQILLTEDLSHNQTIDGVRIVDPFKSDPPG